MCFIVVRFLGCFCCDKAGGVAGSVAGGVDACVCYDLEALFEL